MSQSADRIVKFEQDAQKLLQQRPMNAAKISAEIKRLRTWLHKHQDDAVPGSAQNKLWTSVRSYNAVKDDDDNKIADAARGLLDDYLQIPEGKLCTSKTKQTALKLLQSLDGGGGVAPAEAAAQSTDEVWIVSEAGEDEASLCFTLMSEDGADILENVKAETADLAKSIAAAFQTQDEVLVRVRRGTDSSIVKIETA